MKALAENEIVEAFRVSDRKALVMPTTPDWDHLDFLGWVHRSGHLGFILCESDHGPVGIALQRQVIRTPGPRRFMCDICCTIHDQGGAASFTKWDRDKCRSRTRIACTDLSCSLYVQQLKKSGTDQMPETLDRQQKIDRVVRNVDRMLRYWTFRD